MTTLPRLTRRRVSVLLLLELGKGYKAIAAELEIHEETVRDHVQAIAQALPNHREMSPRDKVLLWCERLLAANADIVDQIRRAA